MGKNGESLYIMETAASLLSQSGLRFKLWEVAEIVVNFDCGVFFDEEFLEANHDMEVTLELKVFTEDAEGNKIENIPVAVNKFNAHQSQCAPYRRQQQCHPHDASDAGKRRPGSCSVPGSS